MAEQYVQAKKETLKQRRVTLALKRSFHSISSLTCSLVTLEQKRRKAKLLLLMDNCHNKLSAAESACNWHVQRSKAAYRHAVASAPSLDPQPGCSSWVGSQPSEAVVDAAQRVLDAIQQCEEVDE